MNCTTIKKTRLDEKLEGDKVENIDYRDKKYDRLVSHIEMSRDAGISWEDISKLTNFRRNSTVNDENVFDFLKSSTFYNDELDQNLWDALIKSVKESKKEKKVHKMGSNVRNNAEISVSPRSAWQTYKRKLESQGWTKESIDNLQESAYEILQNMTMKSNEDGSIKGLAIGNVQSGKTANMVALMAMAADNGFNYFVILSGVIDKLRLQTATRMYDDLNYASHNIQWKSIDNPSKRSPLPEHNLSSLKLGKNDHSAYYSVVLKNHRRLGDFVNWILESDLNKVGQLKMLVIDDEADQASVNTKKLKEEDPSTINKQLSKLVNSEKVMAMNYIAYTATPYANILNDASPTSLYPKDFIIMLGTNSEYIGPEQMFALQEPETQANIDVIREISESDRDIINEIHDGELITSIPESLKESINWFLLSVAAMRTIHYKKPISMLVHTSYKIVHHKNIENIIEKYLREVRKNYDSIKYKLKKIYETEKRYFSRQHFLDGMEDYSTPEDVKDYPAWEEVEGYLDLMMYQDEDKYLSHIPIGDEGEPTYHLGVHLVVDNSKSKSENQIIRLVYPTKRQLPNLAPAFIVIGGNTLSRGLTLEGLVSTYFLRTTNQADTLMQMGRWFGYRKGYELYPRVWLDRLAGERFEFLSQLNMDLREEVEVLMENGLSPSEYAVMINNSPSRHFMRITSNNKQQSAIPSSYDFSGYSSQTIYFDNDKEKLLKNFNLTKKFLNDLKAPKVKGSKMVWSYVDHNVVKEYLNNYEVCQSDRKMSSLPELLKWIDKNIEKSETPFTNWNVILSSKKNIIDTTELNDEWEIHGYHPLSVERSKLKSRSTDLISSIGTLRTPIDLVSDANLTSDEISNFKAKKSIVQKLRKKYELDRTPLLIIYRIDKSGGDESHLRSPLDFSVDPIGISLLMPGFSRSNVPVSHIKVSLLEEDDIEEGYYSEGD